MDTNQDSLSGVRRDACDSHACGEGTSGAPVVDLAQSRARIDEIDERIIDLFQRRMRIARDVAAYKKANGKAVFDKTREDAKVRRARELADDEFKDYMAPLFDTLMEMSRSYQDGILAQETPLSRAADAFVRAPFPQKARVACQGVEGAYSHIAVTSLFARPQVDFYPTWEGVCDAVEVGDAEFGVLPLENSTAGAVDRVYALMESRGLSIVRATTMRIEHDLLAKPGVSIEDVREVFSHEQALRQCEGFIAGLPGNAVASVRANTAMAAQAVAESPRRDVAAISSEACARIYGLDVLARDIQDEGDNFTRFVCVARQPALYGRPTTSSFLLVTPHEAGALHRVLARLATLGINMTKLQSRPIPGREFEFMFYVDVQCVPGDEAFDAMARQIPTLCDVCRYLGSYEEESC